MTNADVARMLYEFAEMMEMRGDVFKRNAYRRAAHSIEALDRDVEDYHREGRLEDIPGVGKSIANAVSEMVETGTSHKLEALRLQYPQGLANLMRVPEVGPRTVARLRKELGVTNIEELKKAALDHRIRDLKGFGEKSEQSILRGILVLEKQGQRLLLGLALPIAEDIVEHIRRATGLPHVSVAGSMRRMKETVGDMDVLVGAEQGDGATEAFLSYPRKAEVLSKGTTRSSMRLADGTQVDLRVVPAQSYGAALQYFTGSKDHNVQMRRLAIQKGYKLNEYGVFRKEDDTPVAGANEEEIYRLLGLDFIPPELRENRGELEAAAEHRLPDLVGLEDIRGDLHIHTVLSDGRATMREVAEEAIRRGYAFVGVTDHSPALHIAGGVSIKDLLASVEEAHRLSEELDFTVLRGTEVDIMDDGSLDYPDEVLSQLDYVIASVHRRFRMDRKEMTDRLMTAMSNEHLNIIGHPTGRILGKREPYEVDMDRLMEAATEQKVFLEVNGFPNRLDLNDRDCRRAREHGTMVALGTDAHGLEQMDNMALAVATARRGWLEAGSVLNARPTEEVVRLLHR